MPVFKEIGLLRAGSINNINTVWTEDVKRVLKCMTVFT